MPLSKLLFKPGLNLDQTNYTSEGSWVDGDKIRFRSGMPEKFGGWRVSSFIPYLGVARSLLPWRSSTGIQVTGIGTNEKIYIEAGTQLFDITPIRATFNTPSTDDSLATVNGSDEITINVLGLNALEGDYITISGATAIGGIPATDINKEHVVISATTNTAVIKVNTPATSTEASGGGTALVIEAQVSVGFAITTEGLGWGTGTYSRGTFGSSITAGSGQTIISLPSRLIHQETFNNDLLFNIRGGDIFYWEFNVNVVSRAIFLYDVPGAIAVPRRVTKIITAPTGHLLALGCTNYDALNTGNADPRDDYLGAYDPLLIRWANVDSFVGPQPENWQPTLTNNAGFIRIEQGSEIITGLRTRQEVLIWTNISLTSFQFIGTEEVFGRQEMSSSISILGPNAVVDANNVVFWMGVDKFYMYNGRVDTLPCNIRQYVFSNINLTQRDLVFGGTNNQFNEIIWFYPTANSDEVNRYVIYNYEEQVWYYGQLERTAWVDAGITPRPLATSGGWVYEHESGTDDGQPLGAPSLPIESFIQSADVDIDDGDKFLLVRRVIPDLSFKGSTVADPVTGQPLVPEATMTVGVRDFPGAVSLTTNASDLSTDRDVISDCESCSPTTALINQYTNQVFVRARGRQMNFRISSDTLGTQWQLGSPRVDARPDGGRG